MEKETQFGIYKRGGSNMRSLVVILLVVMSLNTLAQSKEFKSDRKKAFAQIESLRDGGALVLRLSLHKKNADLYRKAGNIKLADKLEKDLRLQNQLLATTFLDESFNFCDVYIIETKDYGRVINGEESGYFLDRDLNIDSSIVLTHKNILFIEVGNVYEVVRRDDSFLKSEVSSTPIVQNALVIKDRNMEQLMKPFPFNVPLDGIFLDPSSFVVYQKGKENGDLKFEDMTDYNNYMRKKYNFNKKQIFVAQKIFNLNLRLFGFHATAMNVKFRALEVEEEAN